jgi:hypothetical protein
VSNEEDNRKFCKSGEQFKNFIKQRLLLLILADGRIAIIEEVENYYYGGN